MEMGQNPPEEEKQKEMEAKMARERVLRVMLTPEARQRLTNIRMVKQDLAKAVEDYLLSMASQGKLNKALTDDELRKILASVQQPKRDFKINYR
ncbi:MAG: DNA-binding protein [Nitrososphaerales archaeon]